MVLMKKIDAKGKRVLIIPDMHVPFEHKSTYKFLKALNYTGVSEIEFLFDPKDGKYKFIEMNARTWLWVSLARKCGIDFPLIIYNYLNKRINNFPQDYPENIKWVHIWTDFCFSITGIIKGKYSLPEIMKSFKGMKEFAVFSSWPPGSDAGCNQAL